MQAIEEELVIPADGKLPDSFRSCFGRKAKVIILLPEELSEEKNITGSDASVIQSLASSIDAFRSIEDPVAWQKSIREEWDQ